jgi:solute carrier family 25 folate transporter 32
MLHWPCCLCCTQLCVLMHALPLVQVCLMTNPVWLIKTRMQLQQRGASQHTAAAAKGPAPTPYRGFLDALWQIGKQEGLRGYYRGLGPSLVLVSPH